MAADSPATSNRCPCDVELARFNAVGESIFHGEWQSRCSRARDSPDGFRCDGFFRTPRNKPGTADVTLLRSAIAEFRARSVRSRGD